MLPSSVPVAAVQRHEPASQIVVMAALESGAAHHLQQRFLIRMAANRFGQVAVGVGITGDYPAIMRFINSIERDQTFFIIRAMAFTGQQGGMVNLRLQLSTWLRPADAAASGLPSTPPPGTVPAGGKEGE